MCGSMADIQSPTAEIRLGKKERKKKEETTRQNIMVCPIPQGDHNYGFWIIINLALVGTVVQQLTRF